MKKILLVEGMSCGHCEMAVKKAITSIDGISEVIIDLKSGKVTVIGENINDDNLKEAVDDAGYSVVTIE